MTDGKPMGLLAALQARKAKANESQATAPAPESSPKTESRPGSLLAALSKSSQKTESSSGVAPSEAERGAELTATETEATPVKSVDNGSGQGTTGEKESVGSAYQAAKDGESKAVVTSPVNRLLAAQKAAAVAPKQESYDHLFDKIPENFKEVLDRFDELLIRDQGVNDMNVMHLRDYVQRIFVDLANNPEYDGLIIDRDVHNVIKYMRAVKGQAQELAVEKQAKAAKSTTNRGKKNKFAEIGKGLDFNALPKSVTELADFEDME